MWGFPHLFRKNCQARSGASRACFGASRACPGASIIIFGRFWCVCFRELKSFGWSWGLLRRAILGVLSVLTGSGSFLGDSFDKKSVILIYLRQFRLLLDPFLACLRIEQRFLDNSHHSCALSGQPCRNRWYGQMRPFRLVLGPF